MKTFLERFGRTVAACLLLAVGITTQASTKWTGSALTLKAGEWNAIASTGVSIKNGTTLSYNSSSKCIEVAWNSSTGAYAYLVASADVCVTLSIAAGTSKTMTIEGGDYSGAFSVGITAVNVTFDMQSGVEYKISAPAKLSIKGVEVFTPGSDYIVLDESDSRIDNEAKISGSNVKKIRIVRTLKAGQWNTFCLPITISTTDFKSQLKCSAVYELSGYDAETGEVTFKARTASNGESVYSANLPCLIMPDEDIVNPWLTSASNATIDASKLTTTVNDLSFVGIYGYEDIYTTGDENSTKFYLNNSGKLVYPTSNTGNNGKIKGLRAYFELQNGASVKDLTFIFDDDATGVRRVEKDIFGEQGRIYTLDGRYAGNAADNLPGGIYIRNGRKFIVK